jgi:hypothetical protein
MQVSLTIATLEQNILTSPGVMLMQGFSAFTTLDARKNAVDAALTIEAVEAVVWAS